MRPAKNETERWHEESLVAQFRGQKVTLEKERVWEENHDDSGQNQSPCHPNHPVFLPKKEYRESS